MSDWKDELRASWDGGGRRDLPPVRLTPPPPDLPREAPETKVCRRCGVEKPARAFSVNSAHRDGLQAYCKVCSSERRRELYPTYRGPGPTMNMTAAARLARARNLAASARRAAPFLAGDPRRWGDTEVADGDNAARSGSAAPGRRGL
ncbi:MAG TPA: hypothetical protein VFL91_21370 [Thermomicrobiales bacterium]|nr:hypothetical protein [Thermomicrobiales bacterium]